MSHKVSEQAVMDKQSIHSAALTSVVVRIPCDDEPSFADAQMKATE